VLPEAEVPRPARRELLAVAALLLAFAAQLAWGLLGDGLTNDEILYVSAGRRYLALGDYRPDPTHPPLAKMLVAAGLLGLDVRDVEPQPGEDQLAWCRRFFQVENDASLLLVRARLPVVVLCLALALLVWRWARLAAGPIAGLVALGLLAFDPSLLAHGHLATTDLAATFAMLLSGFAFWRWSRAPGLGGACGVALALGVGLGTRLTTGVMLPALALLGLLDLLDLPASARARRARQLGTLALLTALAAPLVIWASYRFRHEPWPGASVAQPVREREGHAAALVGWAQQHQLLPEPFLEGVRFQIQHNAGGHPGYLLGQTARTGFPHYYLVAFLVKSTPGFLLALLAALLTARRRDGPAAPYRHWLVPAALTFLLASLGHIQIGERYLLAVHPLLAMAVGAAAPALLAGRPGRAALATALGLHVGSALLAARESYIAYFNIAAGGTAGGHRYLLDSNLDWGQDLPRLAGWMRRNGVARVQLGYLGADDPARFGIEHDDLPGASLYPERPPERPFEGVVVVSPNLALGLLPRLAPAYERLRDRAPDDRAGVFFVYRPDR
jgi:hypothetical protein